MVPQKGRTELGGASSGYGVWVGRVGGDAVGRADKRWVRVVLATSGNTRTVLHLVRLLAAAGRGAEALAIVTGHRGARDHRTAGEFVEVLVELDRSTYDKRRFGKLANRLVDRLVAQDRASAAIDVLRQFGDAAAMDRLIDLLATMDRVDEAILLAEETANPRNDTWSSVDRLIGLLNKSGRFDDAVARLRADHGRDVTWGPTPHRQSRVYQLTQPMPCARLGLTDGSGRRSIPRRGCRSRGRRSCAGFPGAASSTQRPRGRA
jgi:hypothetical protein